MANHTRLRTALRTAETLLRRYYLVPSALRLWHVLADLGAITQDMLEENESLREEIARLEIRLRQSSRGR